MEDLSSGSSGFHALFSNTTGDFNTASGGDALNTNTRAPATCQFDALTSNTPGNSNTANGLSALFNNRTGGGNTAIAVDADVSAGNLIREDMWEEFKEWQRV